MAEAAAPARAAAGDVSLGGRATVALVNTCGAFPYADGKDGSKTIPPVALRVLKFCWCLMGHACICANKAVRCKCGSLVTQGAPAFARPRASPWWSLS